MRKLNEQWVENGRMYKAVEGENCTGCAFGKMCQGSRLNNIHVCDREDDCPLEYSNTVVKDLGPVNEDGLPPCPFCGEYPKIGNFGDGFSDITFYVKHDQSECVICGLMRTKSFKTKQQAIEAWNQRN